MIKETDLENIPDLLVKFNEPLSKYTYTKVGGPADILAFPATIEALTELLIKAKSTDTAVTVLGNASNLIVRDGGIRGLVILLEKLESVKVAGYTIEAQAGAKLKEVTQVAQANSLTGFEFACGIPGSIGGAVFMNAGAYGGEISQVLVSCKVMDTDGNISVLTASEMQFGYRHSVIRDKNLVVLSAKFELQAGDPTQIQNEMNRLNLQGVRIGGVEVSKKHAGFMVNVANGNATDYEKLIAHVIDKVKENSGVTLEPEVRIIGEK